MPITFRVSLVLGLSVVFLVGCGGDSDSASDRPSTQASSECTERDGAWFGRRADGAMITSQTQEACEERLGD